MSDLPRCPENRVSGEAARGRRPGLGVGTLRLYAPAGGVFESPPIMSLRLIRGPAAATCHGPEGFSFGLGLLLNSSCCNAACCCCFLRSFCESLGAAAFDAASSFSLWADIPIDNEDV